MHPTPAPASAPPMPLTAWVAILAPLVGIALKLASAGWLAVFLLFWSPLLLAGYVAVVLAAARGMLRRQGVLRRPERRSRARIWAWLTSVGVVVLGLTAIDGGDTRESVQSTLTLLLGAPTSPSPLHELSAGIGWAALVAWVVGWLALMVEWAVAVQATRRPVPRVAPPVVE
ncbi:hypothetical protein ACIQC8_10555 [Agrococcus sediminis]|uniref:hypothetical protein n=1 Tax=Agrococcus sediminis TaxID=2599924 RepID=UPI0037FBD55B